MLLEVITTCHAKCMTFARTNGASSLHTILYLVIPFIHSAQLSRYLTDIDAYLYYEIELNKRLNIFDLFVLQA